MPPYVFRVMSEQHFQQSLRDGVHRSDQRNCYPAQKAREPEAWGEEDAPEEGVVAGRWAYLCYLSHAEAHGRVVKIEGRPEDGWRLHPWDDEGGYVHTLSPLPAARFVGWTEPLDATTWRPVRDGSLRVHCG